MVIGSVEISFALKTVVVSSNYATGGVSAGLSWWLVAGSTTMRD
jgi:hypothetical protein